MNLYDFSGGVVNQKSPYHLKRDEVSELCNFDVERGGLTVRAGTVRKYGPFSEDVTAIHKALSVKGHEILFVQGKKSTGTVIGDIKCRIEMPTSSFQVLPVTDGFIFLVNGSPRTLKNVYRRMDGTVETKGVWEGVLILEQLPTDYFTSGDFPEDLYEANIWDEATDTLYYVTSHTNATRENIGELIGSESFVRIGKQGDLIHLRYALTATAHINLKTVYNNFQTYTHYICNSLLDMFSAGISMDETGLKACRCPYIVWHPASMRYFAAGHPDYPTALFISEPNDWKTFLL